MHTTLWLMRALREARATAVGVRLDADDRLHLIAPHGLADLFGLVLRPSPLCRDPQAFGRRLATKRWRERWPRLTVLEPGASS